MIAAAKRAKELGSLYAQQMKWQWGEAGGIHSIITQGGGMKKTEKELLLFEQHLLYAAANQAMES